MALLGLLAACGTDENPVGPTTDTTPPLVVAVDPAADGSHVPIDGAVTVVFNEAMTPASATGNVSLSAGNVTGLRWADDRTLVVSHSTWTPGRRITVTVTQGLEDIAGNPLEATFRSSFWTDTPDVVLLGSDPPDGASGLVLNRRMRLLFSRPMDLTSLAAATTVREVGPGGATLSPSLRAGEGEWVVLQFAASLPAQTDIEIAVDTTATSIDAVPLAQPAQLRFTTGGVRDTTPPRLVTVTPPSGSTLSRDTSYLRMVFDEGIDPESLEPSSIGAQFLLHLSHTGYEPTWSEDRTTVTIPLSPPLPPGLPIVVRVDGIADPSGNVLAQPFEYAATAEGEAEFYPFVDGTTYTLGDREISGAPGDTLSNSWSQVFVRMEEQADGSFHRVQYDDAAFTQPAGWDILRRTAGAVEMLGFHTFEVDRDYDVAATPPITWARLPMGPGAWSGSSTLVSPDTTLSLTYSATVAGPEDVGAEPPLPRVRGRALTLPQEQPLQVLWIGCWRAELTYEMRDGSQTVQSGNETLWYAPTLGIARRRSHQQNADGTWEDHDYFVQDVTIPGQP